MAKILITGSNGLLGTKLLKLIISKNEFAIAISKHACSNACLGSFEFHQLDIIDAEATDKLITAIKPQVIIHCAALTEVDYCEQFPRAAWLVNVSGTRNVVASALKISCRLVYISTEYVFDGTSYRHYKETDLPNPVNFYGRTKLEAEWEVRQKLKNFVICRTAILYGYSRNARQNFVTWVLDNLKGGKKIEVVDDQISTPTLADNLAEMVYAISISDKVGIYHTTGSQAISRYEFAIKVAEAFELDAGLIHPITSEVLTRPAKRPKNSSLCIDKFVSGFPQVKALNIEDGLKVMKEQLVSCAFA